MTNYRLLMLFGRFLVAGFLLRQVWREAGGWTVLCFALVFLGFELVGPAIRKILADLHSSTRSIEQLAQLAQGITSMHEAITKQRKGEHT